MLTAFSGASGSAAGAATASGAGGDCGRRRGGRQHRVKRRRGQRCAVVQRPGLRLVDRRATRDHVPVVDGLDKRVLDRRRGVGGRWCIHRGRARGHGVERSRWGRRERVDRGRWRRGLGQRGRGGHGVERSRWGRRERVDRGRWRRGLGQRGRGGHGVERSRWGRRERVDRGRWRRGLGQRGRGGHGVERSRWGRRERVDRGRRRQFTVEGRGVERLGLVDHVARCRTRQRATAARPGALALAGQHALGDGDLLFLGGEMCGRRVIAAAVTTPGAWRELQPALIPVAGVDGPVAAGFAAGDPVPFAVGGCARLPGEGEAAAADDRAREGDLRDAYCRCSGLAMTSTHGCDRSSLRAREVSCRVRAGEVARPVPRKRHRLHPKEPLSAPGPLVRWTGGSPASIQVVRRWSLPNGWSSARLVGDGPPIKVDWLGSRP